MKSGDILDTILEINIEDEAPVKVVVNGQLRDVKDVNYRDGLLLVTLVD